MKHRIIIPAILLTVAAFTSCVKEKLEDTYNKQEDRIDQYIEKQRYVKRTVQVPARDPETGEIKTDDSGQTVMRDSTVTDTLKVVYNEGTSRLITKEGEGEELKADGAIAFYYAGYTFNGSISPNNLFATNDTAAAAESGWTLAEGESKILTINLKDYELIPGLRNGLIGVKSGEECQIFFSGKYGFGKKGVGIVPANSALAYKIVVESISNE